MSESRDRRKTWGCVLALVGLCALGGLLISRGVDYLGEVQARREVANHMRHLVLSLHAYADTHQGYLPSPTHNDLSKDDLGWRVAIMPYAEGKSDFPGIRQGKFAVGDDPLNFWKHPDLQQRRPFYHRSARHITDPRMTAYCAFVGKGAAFEKGNNLRIPRDFPDGISRTIFVVEATEGVIWCSDGDLPYDPDKPLPPLGHPSRDGFLAAFGDGSVRYIPKNTDEKLIRAMITRNGGERIDELPGKQVVP
jgi:hypothetical protein